MITITLTKQQMLYCIADQINALKGSFIKFIINLVAQIENKQDDELITMIIPVELLMRIYTGVSNYPHAIGKYINPALLAAVQAQLQAQSNYAAYAAFMAAYPDYGKVNEAGEPLVIVPENEMVVANAATLALLSIGAKEADYHAAIDAKINAAKVALEL